jgi:hypothetical protein
MSLSVEQVKKDWSQTYNSEGKPDWSHIFKYYDQNIIFQDSIQKIEGFDDFEKMCNRLTKRCQSLHMKLLNVVKQDNVVMIEWIMTMRFRRLPKTEMFGSSVLTFNDSGKISHQRDYYDLWGDIYNRVPVLKQIYRWFMKVVFG